VIAAAIPDAMLLLTDECFAQEVPEHVYDGLTCPKYAHWYTILVIPVFYQYLPVSAILVQILVNTSIPVSSRIFQYH
jgi:hypothetical protein